MWKGKVYYYVNEFGLVKFDYLNDNKLKWWLLILFFILNLSKY